ncbi:hypothetical protein BT67DRAFT_446505 [Trichocladium antarcticum]|uniref:Uncharacterized protein n=1 Tax=Trichocladium antarcticum TaxID=1450529 RepID=A0AAN6ZI66_9PEZI|nr:hypothetical protein BT67DRAFT_446505 [Trichocladium antarcticum]
MSSETTHGVGKAGLTIVTPRLIQKPSQASLLAEPFPALEEKDTRAPRPSDVSTAATARPNPFETDVEAMITHEQTHNSRKSQECTKGGSDCQAWPGQEHWKRKAKAAKKSRHTCNCLANLSKRNRIIAKLLIILLIVGIAVGVGFGVSKPLGAGIWRNETHNS